MSKILRTSANWRNRRILEAWEINMCTNPLNRDDGMHLPHKFLNLALRDRTSQQIRIRHTINNVSLANYFFHFPLMKVEGSTETLGLLKNIVHIFTQF